MIALAAAAMVAALYRPTQSSPVQGVDFHIAPGPQPPQAADTGSGSSVGKDVPQAAPQRRVIVAQGFGHQVPLAFAMRQIVPSNLRVEYGPGVNRAAIVDWHGGKDWSIVTLETARSAGLKAKFQGHTVLIAR